VLLSGVPLQGAGGLPVPVPLQGAVAECRSWVPQHPERHPAVAPCSGIKMSTPKRHTVSNSSCLK